MANAAKSAPTTKKSERTLKSIAKRDRVARSEYRLQYTKNGTGENAGVKRGDFTDRVYMSEHAVLCAQAIWNGTEGNIPVEAVMAEVAATSVVRGVE